MHDNKILNIDENYIIRRAQVIAEKSWGKLLEAYPKMEMPIALDGI
jgi:hypothetical protein